MNRIRKHNPIIPGSLAVVIGAGASGYAAARLLLQKGAQVRVLEKNADKSVSNLALLDKEKDITIITGSHEPAHFQGASLVVPSPGVAARMLRPLLEAAGNPPVMAEMELAYRFVEEPILAITGTSGKTTTVSLSAAMLQKAGKTVFSGGNLGIPLSEYVLEGDKADVLVLETSSFQLMGCTTFHPQVGVLLNISPNHLDQHESMKEYTEAKFSLFAQQTPEDCAIFTTDLEDEVPLHNIRARREFFSTPLTNQGAWETGLLGSHNQANIRAAFYACREFGVTEKDARSAAAAFAPLAHRLEQIGTYKGISYINDSKGTTVDSLKIALESMARPTLLLAGGKFKGGDLTRLVPLLREKVKAVGLFGDGRAVFEEAWQGIVPLTWSVSLEDAMRRLRGVASEGDAMLLSPATSSFDLYANYEERGNDFRRIAMQLQ
ncbi:UDP-N-acetylmuramoylalanine--D-glutamate ligase [Deltaproteobacteria bacterium]|nr:UDP-N-acetylmuramoylalanine--D-glutamate ligase [Deltaproteobacteria bacterium]